MPSPFVDRMATIDESADNPVAINIGKPGYKLVRVAEANPQPKSVILTVIIGLLTMICSGMLFPLLKAFQLMEIIIYIALLVHTAMMGGAGISPKLFAFSQALDMIPTITELVVALFGLYNTVKSETGFWHIYKIAKGDSGLLIAEGKGLPGVDLIVATCNESVDIILDTVKACLDLDYPLGKLRVVVSDDGRDAALKAALAPLGHVFDNLLYFSRTTDPGKHHGYKAGNINAVLNMLEFQGLEPNPWVCNLDCDMIPDRETLRMLIAPALKDKEVGLVTLPQDFYNIPLNDPLHENLMLQHRRDQMGRAEHNAAWCVGSGFIFSREAWKQVGGFYEQSMCDDVWFGWSLNGSGFKTVYVDSCLQSGLQPENFQDHMKQRRRWFVGGMRNCKALRCGFKAPVLTGMTAMQKAFALKQIPMPYLSTVCKGLVAVLNIVCLVLGILYVEPVVSVRSDHVARILYAQAFHKLATFILDSYSALVWGHNVRRRAVVNIWQGMHLVKSGMAEHLPSWLGGYTLGFVPTGAKSGSLVVNERDASVRPSTGIRLSIAQQSEGVLWHGVYFIIVMGLTLWNVHHIVWASRSWSVMWFWLIAGPLFPGMKLENLFCHLSPIWYFIKPPNMPQDRKELMYLDERTGGYRPKREYRGVRFTKSMWWWELLNIASVGWSLFAFWRMNEDLDGHLLVGMPLPESQEVYQAVLSAFKVFIPICGIALGIHTVGAIFVTRRMAAHPEKDD